MPIFASAYYKHHRRKGLSKMKLITQIQSTLLTVQNSLTTGMSGLALATLRFIRRVSSCTAIVCATIFIMTAICKNPAAAQARSNTGFVWPIGTGSWSHEDGYWMAHDPQHGGHYFDGKYHIGEDMIAPETANVYAISDGDVVKVFTTLAVKYKFERRQPHSGC